MAQKYQAKRLKIYKETKDKKSTDVCLMALLLLPIRPNDDYVYNDNRYEDIGLVAVFL
jgi:hypothetical protein